MSSLLLQENRRRKEAMEALVSDIAHPGNENDEDNITSSIRIALERGWNSQQVKGSNFIVPVLHLLVLSL